MVLNQTLKHSCMGFLSRVDMDQCWRRQDQANKQMQKGGYYDEDIYDFEGTYLRKNINFLNWKKINYKDYKDSKLKKTVFYN